MKRRAIWLWCIVGLLGLAMLATFGGWWAIRQWPEYCGSRLPPALAIRLATLGPQELKAAEACFHIDRMMEVDIDLTPAQNAEIDAALCWGLNGSRDRQLVTLGLFGNGRNGFSPATPERNALVFPLISSTDPELQKLARHVWTMDGVAPSDRIRRIRPEDVDTDHSPLSPDQWVAGRTAGIAWRMLVFADSGSDHKLPSRYRYFMRRNLELLLSEEDGHGRFANDERDHLIACATVCELMAMTNDPALAPVTKRISAALGHDPERLKRLWQDDTTVACLTGMCAQALSFDAGHRFDDAAYQALRASLDAWLAERVGDAPPRWYAHGQVVPASEAELWAAAMLAGWWCGRPATAWVEPPVLAAIPVDCTPFGRCLIRLASVVYGEPKWKDVFTRRTRQLHDTMIITADHQGDEGLWPAHGAVSAAWETVFNEYEARTYWPRHSIIGAARAP